jgi:two-component system, chemotaxis family, response regulator Rcp1
MDGSSVKLPVRTILLIDGSPNDAALMEAQFRLIDVRAKLFFVADGEEAIGFLLNNSPHEEAPRPALIFLDMPLANDGGFEMLTLVKRDVKFSRIPVIVLAARADGDVEKAYSLLANCCVRKPVSPDELTDFVGFIKSFWLEMMTLPDGPDAADGQAN